MKPNEECNGERRSWKRHSRLAVLTVAAGFLCAAAALAAMVLPAQAQDALPANLANDPVTKALGADVVKAARKEGTIAWYGSTTTQHFLRHGGKERFEKRFGIKIESVIGPLRSMTDRIRTENALNKQVADVFDANDQYMLELHSIGALYKWRPPAPELAKINPVVFVREPAGYWWPVHVSAQGLIVNTSLIDPKKINSYWDLIDSKYAGKVGIRDPRDAGGGAWHMLGIYNEPGLGLDYIKKLKEVDKPFIVHGASRALRDAVLRGQFAVGFSGRGEFFRDLPKGMPLAWVVPKEGLAWTPSSMAIITKAPHPNAAKVLLTWFYEVPQLQLWTDWGRPVPDPNVKVKLPQMSVSAYPLMHRIPDEQLAHPNFFFKKMEEVFGIR